MNIVVEVIAAYLLSNRRLVVPAFGAFMVKESGERVFSELLRTDDGVLASLLREKGLNEMEVAVMVDRFIFEVRHELEQYGYCRLGEIGTLRIEPSTKVLRLYPPVQGEIPKQTPYIPKPIQPTESEEVVVAPKEESVTNEEPQIETPNTVRAPSAPKKQLKTRKKFDFVMVVAVIILVVALLGIGYGWYVSNLAEVDDAAMEELRVAPNMINE